MKAHDVITSGLTLKTFYIVNFLLNMCPQHYICWSELPMPRISVTFSLREVEEIEKDCAVYRGRLERIAKHSAISREEQVLRHMHIVFFLFFLLNMIHGGDIVPQVLTISAASHYIT